MKIESLVGDVLLQAPGCPEEIAIQHLLLGARQFSRDALAWVEEVESFDFDGESSAVDLAAPKGTSIWAVTSVDLDGKALKGFRWDGSYLALDDPEPGRLTVHAALEPISADVDLPESVSRWSEALVHYALGKVLMMRGKPWADPGAAGENVGMYRWKVTDARLGVAKGGSTAPLRVKAHPRL